MARRSIRVRTRGAAPAPAGGAGTIEVRAPGPLRDLAGPGGTLRARAADVDGLLSGLARSHPELHARICDETGALRRHINIFINTSNIRDGAGTRERLSPGDTVTILPAVSGGSHG